MSWFEDWFDSPLYEKLYASRNEEEAALLADLIESILPKRDFKRLLDLGCGRGRHTITLGKRGYDVTGLDLSERALNTARSKAASQQLKNVRFVQGDMREPIPDTFDAVLNLFTTFGYFLDDSENEKVIASVSDMLNESGLFLIDYLNAELIKDNLDPSDEGQYNQYSYTISRYVDDGMVFKKIQFSGDDLAKPIEYVERVKLYDLNWFQTKLNQHGFEITELFGDYHGNSFDNKNSPRMIISARKI